MSRLWRPVSKREPCAVCGAPDWCAVSVDGRVSRCMRVVEGDSIVSQTTKDGQPYGLQFASDGGPRDNRDLQSRYRTDDEPERADDETLHRVYTALLQNLPLSPSHRADLCARGLGDAEIETRGYRSIPPPSERSRIVAKVREALGGTIPEAVPGISKGKLLGPTGLVVPVRNSTGMIRALKVRADDPSHGKYLWVSSSRDDGPGPGAPCHVPIFAAKGPKILTARVTEGPLKADVATAISGMLTLGVAGSTSSRSSVEPLKSLGVETVRIAWDADARQNHHVAAALRLAVRVYREEGFNVALETWDETAGKGIDDALLAGASISLHTGEAIDKVLASMAVAPVKTLAQQSPTMSASQAAPTLPKMPSNRSMASFDRGDSVELAHAIIESLRADCSEAGADAVIYDRSTFWTYDMGRGIYIERPPSEMLCLAMSFAGAPVGPKGKPLLMSDGGAKGAVKAASWLCARPGWLSKAPKGIVFADRFVYAKGGEVIVEPHSPKHRALHAIDVCYERSAPCPQWIRMCREVFRRYREDGTLDEDDIEGCISLLQEWTGTTLMGEATSRAVCLVLVGLGGDGKSSVLNVIRSLFPASAICSISVQDWSRSFLLAGLAGKRLNAVSELPERDLADGDRFKSVVAGDPLTAERKGQDPFDLVCEAGHIFACNALPRTRDQSAGFWRRFAVLACNRSFDSTEIVHDLWKTIVAQELAGIAAWAIDGAARAQRQTVLTTPESSSSAKAEWQIESDVVRQFLGDACRLLEKGTPSKEESTIADLYVAFRVWCSQTGHVAMARDNLARRLKALGYEHRTTTARLYRIALTESWQSENGLTPAKGTRYAAPPN